MGLKILEKSYAKATFLGYNMFLIRFLPDPSKYCCAKKDLLIKGEQQILATSLKKKKATPAGSEVFIPLFFFTYDVILKAYYSII